MAATDPRRLALDVLQTVLERGRPLDEAFSGHPRLPGLSPRDRGFARMLVATVVRRLGEIDAVLAACLDRPLSGKRARGHDVLRLGAAQLLYLGTPAHAAVATGVELAKAVGLEGLAGLVNAVLRRIARDGEALHAGLDREQLALPDWLWERLFRSYGEAVTRAIVAAQLGDPPLDLTLKDPATAEAWAKRLEAKLLPGGSLRLAAGAGEVTRLEGYAEGAWWVQDTAAALPARLLDPKPGERIADLCAAPGGKTLQLAAAGADTIAVEINQKRLEQLEQNLRRTGLSAQLVQADATSWQPAEPLDALLLDAPCSATGTLRRHPDVALHRRPQEMPELLALQDRLLDAAAALLPPAGRMVYAVCSLLPEEGPARIEALLARNPGLAREPAEAAALGLPAEAVTTEGAIRTLPCHLAENGGMDGFYACRLRRL